MKKLFLAIALLASIQSFAKEGQDGGGGGVISRNGQFLTFGSAGMKINVGNPQGMEQVPSLDLLLNVLDANQRGIDDKYQGQLVQAVLPSETRRYFKIGVNQLNQGTYANLIAEYSKLLKGQIDPNNLALAAITIKEDTFLLPPFFQLKPAEQAAILFHESLWIVKPDISYDELVNAEITLQKHIEVNGTNSVYNADLVSVIGKIFNEPAVVVKAALLEDIRNGVFKKYRIKTKKDHKRVMLYNFGDLFGKRTHQAYYKEDQGALVLSLRKATAMYPESKFIKVLFNYRERINSIALELVTSDPKQMNIESSCFRSYSSEFLNGSFLDFDDDGGSELTETNYVCFR